MENKELKNNRVEVNEEVMEQVNGGGRIIRRLDFNEAENFNLDFKSRRMSLI